MLLVTPVIGTRGRHLDDPTADAVTRRSDLHGWHPRRERRWITNSAGVKPAGTCTCCKKDHTNVDAYVHHPRGRSSRSTGKDCVPERPPTAGQPPRRRAADLDALRRSSDCSQADPWSSASTTGPPSA